MVYTGKDGKALCVIAGYCPSKSNNGHLLVSQQHWWQFATYDPATTMTPHPCTAFWNDFQPLLKEWINQGNQIIMGCNANEKAKKQGITDFFVMFSMTEASNSAYSSTTSPPTHQCGLEAINDMCNPWPCFSTSLVDTFANLRASRAIDASGWIYQKIGSLIALVAMPAIVRAGACRLKLDDPHTRNTYLKMIQDHFTMHQILNKVQ